MYKKSLLSSMATAAIMLFNIQFNVHAESLKVSGEKKEVKDTTYETLHALKEGQITGTDLKVTGNKDTNSSSNENIYVISVEGKGSAIKLTGDKTTIKGTDSDIPFGLEAKDDAILQMTGGTITISGTGVHFKNSNSTENKLENVTISSVKGDTLLHYGIYADESTIALTNVKVSQATNAIVADDHSTITVSGGSFDAKLATIVSQGNSIITLTNNTQITSSENAGLYAKDGGAISMTGGNITGQFAALSADNGGHITVTNVTLEAKGNGIDKKPDNPNAGVTITNGFGAYSQDSNSVIELLGDTKINNSKVGLGAKNGGAISMTGGAIKASEVGAVFENSKRQENKLENLTISSSKDDALLKFGITADKSTVTLNNVTVTKAGNAIIAGNESKITISGGSFEAKNATIGSNGNSIISLTNNAQITSSENSGLYAKDDGAISMTGGVIKASEVGAGFVNSKRKENKLENVTISSSKDDALLTNGIKADDSTVDLKNVKVSQAMNAVIADDHSIVTVSGGSFETKNITIGSNGNSIVTLTNNAQITSSENSGLYAKDDGAISMTGGNIKASNVGAHFENSKRKENKLENVTVSQAKNAIVADDHSTVTVSGGSFDAKKATIGSQGNSLITLINDAQITSSEDAGLLAKDGGAISMTGGTIKAFYDGASFQNSKRKENKLENVTISSSKDDVLLKFGVAADKSTVDLNNVTVTKAENAISANNESEITVSGGSFSAKQATIVSKGNSIVTLTNNAQIISSEDCGLYAKEGGAISMTGGNIKAFYDGASFENSKRKENKLENVIISSGKDDALLHYGIGAEKNSTIALTNVTVSQAENAISANGLSTVTVSGGSFDAKGATIDSHGNSIITLINDAQITSSEDAGLLAKDGGAISMTGGTIKAFYDGASFQNSKRKENKLENVIISSGKDDALLHYGIGAEKNSTVALTNVTVSQAENAISANGLSTVTVSGGSFDAKYATIRALNGSTITLTDKAQITSHRGNGIYAGASGSKVIMTGGTIKSEADALFAESSGHIKVTNVSIATNGTGTGAVVLGPESVIELSGITMKNVFSGLAATEGGKITSENLTIIGGKAINSDPDLDPDTERVGITTEDAESEINLTGTTTIQNVDKGLYADGGSKITSGDLTIIGGESEKITSAVGSYEPESKIELNGKTTIKSFDLGLSAANGSSINMKNGTKNEIDVKKVALSAIANGKIDLANTVVKAGSIGMQLMAFSKTNTNKLDDLQTYENSEINLTNTNIHVDNGTGILIGALAEKSVENSPALSIGTLNLKDSEIHANVLLDDGIWEKISWKDKNFWNDKKIKETANGSFTLNANHSILEGRTNITKERNVRFDLTNQAKWFLKTSLQEKDADGVLHYIAYSAVSVLNLNDSSVIFKEPTTDGYYHTLHIGYGKPDTKAVYNATGNAQISFNTLWSDGKPIIEQKTDRLLIYGDVSGNTNVFVAGYVTKNNSQKNNSEALDNIRGLSLIQVSGKAEEGSFKLVNGYTTLNGSPNKYMLLAYGPNSSHGNAEASQSLVGNSDNFWDFRLQPEFINTNPDNPNTNPDNPNTNPDNPNTNPDNPNTNPDNPNTNPDNPNTNPDNPNTNPDNPNTNPDNPNTNPDNPNTNPDNPNTNPDNPNTNPDNPNTNPDNPNTNPDNPNTNPDNPNTNPDNPNTNPDNPNTNPDNPNTNPDNPNTNPDNPNTNPDNPNTNPDNPNTNPEKPSSNPGGSGSNSGPEQNVQAVVPQMASYLLMPNALFYTGLTDMAKQNALLANMRTSLLSKQQEKQSGFFLYTYGSTGNFSSENAPRQYGYSGAHLRYAALQGGVNFAAIERQNTTIHFGLLGTYGQLSFTPKNMKDASKSTVDKWSITAYGSIQHDNGVYLDTLLSYGVLKGDITNAIIGTTAKLKNAKMWSVSTTVGKQFATGIQGLTFEPQAQLAYQHLLFDTISDADHFTIDMNNPHQWMIRVGGRLTKTVAAAENGRSVSFYGKVNAIKIFDDNQAIHIDKDYKLDPMGSLLEGGLGINAQLSSNISLHGDISYQQKLQKTGISGASFSGGIRYRF